MTRPTYAGMRTFLFVIFVAVLLTGVHASSMAQQTAIQEFRDPQNRLIGKVVTRADGSLEARSYSNRYLGYFDPRTNITQDADNRMVGRGNFLSALIDRSARDIATARVERAPSYELKHPHEVTPSAALQNRAIIPPEVKSRHGRMAPSVTQEDRLFAIDALQAAMRQRGQEINWRNPDTGNSGSYIATDDVFDTSVNGRVTTCRWVRMTLRAAREVDVQRQGVCQRGDNGLWTVAIVDADAL